MDKFLNGLTKEDNFTFTENGAVALHSSLNGLLDAFGTIGSMRRHPENEIIDTFYKALAEDKAMAFKLLFWLRDARQGAGERRSFRILLKDMAVKYPNIIRANIENIPFYGRYDDLLVLLDTPLKNDVIKYIKETLKEDMIAIKDEDGYPSLLAKWLPSINTSSAETRRYAKIICSKLGLQEKEYRKTLSILRNKISIVEKLMSENRWGEIDFSKIPSKASVIYTNAFLKHNSDGYVQYLKDVAEGKAKINASVLMPIDVIHKVMEMGRNYKETDKYLYDALWNALPNYFNQTDKVESGLCVVDVSGSMNGQPMEVAISLGMYCADKANGAFKDHFITFSAEPKLQKVKGNDIFEKVNNMQRADWDQNTNIEKVFNLILETAVKTKCSQEEIPNKLYIISDMQFDEASGVSSSWYRRNPITNFNKETFIETMRKRFEAYGYTMPNLVYWNVRPSSYGGKVQETVENENGFCMVSGFSASLFKSVIMGTEYVQTINEKGETVVKEILNPITVMMNTLNGERYERVVTE